MPTKYKPKPVELHKIDYGTAKSHWMNLRVKKGLPAVSGADIKKGTSYYNEVVLLQQTLKEKDFVLLLAELADTSPTHWNMAAKYWEKRGWEVQIAGEVLADAKQFYTNEPPVSVIIQETKKEEPQPSITIQETKKPVDATVEFKNLSMFQQQSIIRKIDEERDAILEDMYERGDTELDAVMDAKFKELSKDVKAKRKILFNSAEYNKQYKVNFSELATYD